MLCLYLSTGDVFATRTSQRENDEHLSHVTGHLLYVKNRAEPKDPERQLKHFTVTAKSAQPQGQRSERERES